MALVHQLEFVEEFIEAADIMDGQRHSTVLQERGIIIT